MNFKSGIFALALSAISTVALPTYVSAQEIDMEVLGPQIREYLMENPLIVVDALAAGERLATEREAQERQAMVKALGPQIYNSATSPVIGNPDGTGTIVEFFDYQCGYCKRAADGLFAASDADGKVRIVLKELPILGPESLVAAKAALASGMQGKYDPMHRALIAFKGRLSEKSIMSLADRIGLDTAKLKVDMESAEVQKELDEVRQLASSLSINGTPAFIVNDELVPGAVPTESLMEMVEAERQKG